MGRLGSFDYATRTTKLPEKNSPEGATYLARGDSQRREEFTPAKNGLFMLITL